MAQRMTPTRKTRKEDSFDRGQNDENKEEEEGKLVCVVLVWCCAVVWCGIVCDLCITFYAHFLKILTISTILYLNI